jgi:hypothetical protein
MKISDILNFMGIKEYTIRGDIDYNESIVLEELNADWSDGIPSNEEFHAAAPLCLKELEIKNLLHEKYMSYPNHTDWLLALTKQIELISKEGETCEEFSQLRISLDSLEEKYMGLTI